MTPKAKKALEGSIRKWEGIIIGDRGDLGHENCALCKEFHSFADDGEASVCDGCPVMEVTGKVGCGGTPYWRYRKALEARFESAEAYTPNKAERRAAFAMLRFLESLR